MPGQFLEKEPVLYKILAEERIHLSATCFGGKMEGGFQT